MENNGKDSTRMLALLLIIGAVALITLFIRTPFFLIFSVFLFAILIAFVFYGVHKGTELRRKRALANTVEGKILSYREQCDSQIARHKEEIEDIKKNIEELESKLTYSTALKEETIKESRRIIAGFKTELQLRETKLNFYKTCKGKIKSILDNHKLTEDLVKKQEKLNKLQEQNYDDLATMESLKSEVEMDRHYVDSIEELSLKMLDINSIESAEAVQMELIEMTKSLKDL